MFYRLSHMAMYAISNQRFDLTAHDLRAGDRGFSGNGA
jgi:hypothetical protein